MASGLVAEFGMLGAVFRLVASLIILGVAIALYIGIGIGIAYLVRRLGDRDEKGAFKEFREEEWDAFIQVSIVVGWGLVLLSLPVLLPIIVILWACSKVGESVKKSEKAVH